MEERNKKLEIVKQVVNILRLDKDEDIIEVISERMDLRNDLGFDSFDLAEFTVRIEEKLGVDVFEKGLVNNIKEVIDIESVAKMVLYLSRTDSISITGQNIHVDSGTI